MTDFNDIIDDVWEGYLDTALWSGLFLPDDPEADMEPLDNYVDELTNPVTEQARADCWDFLESVGEELLYEYVLVNGDWREFGQNFALTRNYHGTGFWDSGLGELGDKLTELAHAEGEANLQGLLTDEEDESTVPHPETGQPIYVSFE